MPEDKFESLEKRNSDFWISLSHLAKVNSFPNSPFNQFFDIDASGLGNLFS